MFSKEDFRQYADDIRSVEEKMVAFQEDWRKKAKSKEIRQTIDLVLKDERKHCRLALEIAKLLFGPG